MSQRSEPQDTILAGGRTIAVVGLSPRPDRDSHRVAAHRQQQGYRIVPVNPEVSGTILGEPVYAALDAVPVEIDIVNVFRRSSRASAAIDAAIRVGAKAVWLQLDIRNADGLQRARAAGLLATEDRCITVEHRRWRAAAPSPPR